MKQAAKATGQGEDALRAKLAALQEEIRKAGQSSATDEALRAKLAEFEANLRALASSSKQPVVMQVAAEPVVIEIDDRFYRSDARHQAGPGRSSRGH